MSINILIKIHQKKIHVTVFKIKEGASSIIKFMPQIKIKNYSK